MTSSGKVVRLLPDVPNSQTSVIRVRAIDNIERAGMKPTGSNEMAEQPFIGQCFCGRVRYEVERPLKFMVHDHCSICRKISGAPMVTWAGVLDRQFQILTGAEHLTAFRSSPEAERQFCNHCGTNLFFRSTIWPGEVHFTVGTLISPFSERPEAHVFYSDRAEWMEEEAKIPKYGGSMENEPLS